MTDLGLELLNDYEERTNKPNVVLYTSLVRNYVAHRRYDEALALFRRLRHRGGTPGRI